MSTSSPVPGAGGPGPTDWTATPACSPTWRASRCEVIEAENPLEVLDYEFVPDTGGAGKFRGGMSQRKTWRMLADEGILQVRADRQTHRPYGLYGGGPGAPGVNVLDPGLPTRGKAARQADHDAAPGQVFRHELPGAGGWGAALERDLAAGGARPARRPGVDRGGGARLRRGRRGRSAGDRSGRHRSAAGEVARDTKAVAASRRRGSRAA